MGRNQLTVKPDQRWRWSSIITRPAAAPGVIGMATATAPWDAAHTTPPGV